MRLRGLLLSRTALTFCFTCFTVIQKSIGGDPAATSTAWACVEHMAELAMVVPCDHTDVWMATKLRKLHSDYEDNLVIAAALRGKADLLVTYDKQLRAHATVAVADPASARAWLDTL